MGLELVLVIFALIAGIIVLSLASRIGIFIYNFYVEIVKQAGDNFIGWWAKPFTLVGPKLYIWFLRLTGICFIFFSLFIIISFYALGC